MRQHGTHPIEGQQGNQPLGAGGNLSGQAGLLGQNQAQPIGAGSGGLVNKVKNLMTGQGGAASQGGQPLGVGPNMLSQQGVSPITGSAGGFPISGATSGCPVVGSTGGLLNQGTGFTENRFADQPLGAQNRSDFLSSGTQPLGQGSQFPIQSGGFSSQLPQSGTSIIGSDPSFSNQIPLLGNQPTGLAYQQPLASGIGSGLSGSNIPQHSTMTGAGLGIGQQQSKFAGQQQSGFASQQQPEFVGAGEGIGQQQLRGGLPQTAGGLSGERNFTNNTAAPLAGTDLGRRDNTFDNLRNLNAGGNSYPQS